MDLTKDEYLAHYGILRRSGRYPWGSGGPETASNSGFLGMVDGLRKKGLSEVEIAKGLGVTTSELRAAKTIALAEQKQSFIDQAQKLKDKGYSNVAIGKRMNIPESQVRALLKPGEKNRADVLQGTASMLKDQVDKKGFIDVGTGVEHHIGVSSTKMGAAIAILREQGYELHRVKVTQLGTGHQTELKVLAKPGTTQKQVWQNRDNIKQISESSNDGGRSFTGIRPPTSISSKRVAVRYAEDGGTDADGVMYIRPGKEDLSLGGSRYAQVRIAVDGTHYLKGMAMYKDDLPPGVDIMFNTNKKNTGNKLDAMKKMNTDKDGNVDMENPFGATIKPGGQRGAFNIVNEQGDWNKWSKTLSSQILSKQSPRLAREQLDMAFQNRKDELDNIKKLTNPTVRRKLLETYADGADAASVHLKAAQLPRQANKVILPVNSMKEGEIYAPTFRNGERVALLRHPHGGIFEIPELTVNNRHPEARKLLGDSPDAVGIHSKVAERLSGADFDGDTVLVIPNNSRAIKTKSALAGLKGFDPITAYPGYDGMTKMTPRQKQAEMGAVSNLITDMTIRGANDAELARAVRHSMVVIDAEKHGLNWKASAINNGIPQLKEKYQGGKRAGASTLISRAGSETRLPMRKPRSAAKGGPVDVATGRKVFEPTGQSFVNKQGKVVVKKQPVNILSDTTDAHTLSSGTPIERIYADHSNRMKGLANDARRSAVTTRSLAYSPSAKTVYSKEVASLNSKLNLALRNAPLERQAQVLANAIVTQKLRANRDLEPDEIKKIKSQQLTAARIRTGARKERIVITDDEWAAIQAGAISNNKLNQILDNADLDQIRLLATPRQSTLMTGSKLSRARSMKASGYTQAEIADALGVSVSTLERSL